MSKRIISVVLCVVMLFSLSIAAFAADVNYKEVKGQYSYCPSLGFLDIAGNQMYDFEYSDAYFCHTGYEYDHNLAKVSMVLTQASFASASHNADWSDGNENFNALMEQCGFSNMDCNEDAVTHPGLETIGIYSASKQIMDNGGAYTLIALSFRGHNYGGEWYGNFDVGTSGDHRALPSARRPAWTSSSSTSPSRTSPAASRSGPPASAAQPLPRTCSLVRWTRATTWAT